VRRPRRRPVRRRAPHPSAAPAPSLPPSSDTSGADVCAAASAESPVVVDVTTLAPRAPVSADEPFQVAGRLVNCG
jgi:hypothetical protein